MITEAISIKLIIDFLSYLKKCRLYATNIRVLFWDKSVNEYITFSDLSSLILYYEDNYKLSSVNCETGELGNLCSISSFSLTSDLYKFDTFYTITDVLGNLKVTSGKSYDINRNIEYDRFLERQRLFIQNSISEYRLFFFEINRIYVTGVYAQCYALPGWVQNSWYLDNLKSIYIRQGNSFL